MGVQNYNLLQVLWQQVLTLHITVIKLSFGLEVHDLLCGISMRYI